jgi:hypothetical protein
MNHTPQVCRSRRGYQKQEPPALTHLHINAVEAAVGGTPADVTELPQRVADVGGGSADVCAGKRVLGWAAELSLEVWLIGPCWFAHVYIVYHLQFVHWRGCGRDCKFRDLEITFSYSKNKRLQTDVRTARTT